MAYDFFKCPGSDYELPIYLILSFRFNYLSFNHFVLIIFDIIRRREAGKEVISKMRLTIIYHYNKVSI